MKVLTHSSHRLVLTHQPWGWWLLGLSGVAFLPALLNGWQSSRPPILDCSINDLCALIFLHRIDLCQNNQLYFRQNSEQCHPGSSKSAGQSKLSVLDSRYCFSRARNDLSAEQPSEAASESKTLSGAEVGEERFYCTIWVLPALEGVQVRFANS